MVQRLEPLAEAAVFEPTDWRRLDSLATIVEAYWRQPSADALSEIRTNEERLGAIVVDRMRARMRIKDADGRLPWSPCQRRKGLRDRLAADE